MKNEIINIATLSKGRLKDQAEKVFKKWFKNYFKSERSLIDRSKDFNIHKMDMNATEITEALVKVCADWD